MDSDDQFFIRLWTLAAIVLSVLIISMSIYYGYRAFLVAEVILDGTNPIDASCAFDGRLDGSCSIRAVK